VLCKIIFLLLKYRQIIKPPAQSVLYTTLPLFWWKDERAPRKSVLRRCYFTICRKGTLLISLASFFANFMGHQMKKLVCSARYAKLCVLLIQKEDDPKSAAAVALRESRVVSAARLLPN